MSTPPKYVRHVPSASEVRDSIERVLAFTDRYDSASACDILFTACGRQMARCMATDPADAIARAEQSASRLVEAVVRATQEAARPTQRPGWNPSRGAGAGSP